MAPLSDARMACADRDLIAAEFRNAAAMLRHACHRGVALLDGRTPSTDELPAIITEHRRLWLARNREGGLKDSVQRLERLLIDRGGR